MKWALTILVLMSSAATYWLWRGWSFVGEPPLLSVLLCLNTIALLVLPYDFIAFFLANKIGPDKTEKRYLKRWQFWIPWLVMISCTSVLAYQTLYWLKVYYLPLQVAVVVINLILFARRRGWIFKSTPKESSKSA